MKQKKSAKTQLLLLEDVVNLGKKGELASAKPGFIRNYLLPQKKAVIAEMVEKSSATLLQTIGQNALLNRKAQEPKLQIPK